MSAESIVRCSAPGCHEPAAYKVAAPWCDDRFWELKTYGFACLDHVKNVLSRAEARWLAYQPAAEETLHEIGIYRYEPGKIGRQLQRDPDAEESVYS